MDFDEHESDWFTNVELMISRLKDYKWAERGLPITPAVDTGGSRTSPAPAQSVLTQSKRPCADGFRRALA